MYKYQLLMLFFGNDLAPCNGFVGSQRAILMRDFGPLHQLGARLPRNYLVSMNPMPGNFLTRQDQPHDI